MAEKGYGEVKARANIFPSDIDKFSEQGVGIVLVQAKASHKTKQKAEAKGIKLYDDLSKKMDYHIGKFHREVGDKKEI